MKKQIYKIDFTKTDNARELSVRQLSFQSFYPEENRRINRLIQEGWKPMTILNYNYETGFERYYCLYNPGDYKVFESQYKTDDFGISELALPWCLMGAFKALNKSAGDFLKLTDLEYYNKIYYFDDTLAPLYKEKNEISIDYKDFFDGEPGARANNETEVN